MRLLKLPAGNAKDKDRCFTPRSIGDGITVIIIPMRVYWITLGVLFGLSAFDLASFPGAASLEPASGSVLCPPGVYARAPSDCLPLGPSQTLQEWAQQGIPYPLHALPAYSPDVSLNNVPYRYYRAADEAIVYLFSSLEEAMAGGISGQSLGIGRKYFSYQERFDTAAGVFYRLRNGLWIRGGAGSAVGLPMPFQGLLFSSTPLNGFGWVLGEAKSRAAPAFHAPLTGRTYYRFNVVQVYTTQERDGIVWVLIGPEEWIEDRLVAVVLPRREPPEGITTHRWIEVDLAEQTLTVYEDRRLVFATLVSSGIEPYWTRPGLFQVYQKKEAETMRGAFAADRSDFYYLEDVPWTMYFDEERALHGAYWHAFFGYPTSHGCVNLSPGDAHWLFDWAEVGDWVYVHDPSGRTPTDPSLYGSGAP